MGFEGLRKTHQRAIESMQGSLENESRAKNEAFRHKKKPEADLNELDIALEHANGANSEAQQTIKKYQGQIREAQQLLEQEQKSRDMGREQLMQSGMSWRRPRPSWSTLTVSAGPPSRS